MGNGEFSICHLKPSVSSTSTAKSMMDGNTTVDVSSVTTPMTGSMATRPSLSSEVSNTQNTANTNNASTETNTNKNEHNETRTTVIENHEAATICVKFLPTTTPTKPVTKGPTEVITTKPTSTKTSTTTTTKGIPPRVADTTTLFKKSVQNQVQKKAST